MPLAGVQQPRVITGAGGSEANWVGAGRTTSVTVLAAAFVIKSVPVRGSMATVWLPSRSPQWASRRPLRVSNTLRHPTKRAQALGEGGPPRGEPRPGQVQPGPLAWQRRPLLPLTAASSQPLRALSTLRRFLRRWWTRPAPVDAQQARGHERTRTRLSRPCACSLPTRLLACSSARRPHSPQRNAPFWKLLLRTPPAPFSYEWR